MFWAHKQRPRSSQASNSRPDSLLRIRQLDAPRPPSIDVSCGQYYWLAKLHGSYLRTLVGPLLSSLYRIPCPRFIWLSSIKWTVADVRLERKQVHVCMHVRSAGTHTTTLTRTYLYTLRLILALGHLQEHGCRRRVHLPVQPAQGKFNKTQGIETLAVQ